MRKSVRFKLAFVHADIFTVNFNFFATPTADCRNLPPRLRLARYASSTSSFSSCRELVELFSKKMKMPFLQKICNFILFMFCSNGIIHSFRPSPLHDTRLDRSAREKIMLTLLKRHSLLLLQLTVVLTSHLGHMIAFLACFCLFKTVDSDCNMLVNGFEPWIFGIRSERPAN